MTNRNDNYTNDGIKSNILGMAGNLLIATNSEWLSNYIVVYAFATKELFKDKDIKHNLFGRVATNNGFKADKPCINTLSKYYAHKTIDFVISINELEKIASENNCNFGVAMEIALVNSGLFKHGTNKQDKRKIDLISTKTNKLYQLKTSIVKPNSHGSAGTTNNTPHNK